MSLIKKFGNFFKKNQEMDQDDVEDIKVYFTELFDDLLDIGISRDDFDFKINLKGDEIAGGLVFWDHYQKFMASKELRKFKEGLSKTEYKLSDNSSYDSPVQSAMNKILYDTHDIYVFTIIKK